MRDSLSELYPLFCNQLKCHFLRMTCNLNVSRPVLFCNQCLKLRLLSVKKQYLLKHDELSCQS